MRGAPLVLAALAACATGPSPRFGSLKTDNRSFHFAHNIELIEVSNGLRVALIHDASSNVVTLDLRHDAGAAQDPPGQAGMAHLVEHTLFLLRTSPDGPTIEEELGELTLYSNAETSWDYTSYTATLPVANLEKVLAIEAQRMQPSCDAIDEARFLRERTVVLTEDRERYSALSASMFRMLEDVYGKGHPYTRPIGSAEIATATRADVCKFIESNYSPDRAQLVITGGFDRKAIKGMVGRAFGRVARRHIATPKRPAPARLDGKVTRHSAPVARPTALVFFNFAPWGDEGVTSWHVTRAALAAVLGTADDDHAWITGTDVFVLGGERAPVMVAAVEVDAIGMLDRATEEVFARAALLTEELPPWAFRNLIGAMTFEYIATWDDRRRRGEWIGQFMQFTDHDWFMLRELRSLAVTNWSSKLAEMAGRLTQRNSHIAMLLPSGNAATKVADSIPATSHGVAVWRAPVDPAEADRPVAMETEPAELELETYELANGLRVQLARDRTSPVIDSRLVFPVGRAHTPPETPHLADAAALMLVNEDSFEPGEVGDKLRFGTSRNTELGEEVTDTATTFAARGTSMWADWHVWRLAWRLDRGRYDEGQLRAINLLAGRLAREEERADRADPVVDVLLARLYGEGHPYSKGDPSVKSLASLRLDDLARWRAQHYVPRGATLVVSGDFDVDQMKQEIEDLFGPWADTPPAPLPEIEPIRPAAGPTWLASDRPKALLTRVLVAIASGSDAVREEPARHVLAAMLTDELRVVREGLGATYGVDVEYAHGPAGGALFITALVEERSAGPVLELVLETLRRYHAAAGEEREAFVRARKKALAHALAEHGGATAVAGQLARAASAGQSPFHSRIMASKIAELKPEAVARVAAADLDPARMVVLVRGKPASVDAAYQRISITPERPEPPPAEEPPPPKDVAPPSRPKPSTAGVVKTRPKDQMLYFGSKHAISGPKEAGLYVNQRKVSVDEFLRIGGADAIRTRMRQRRWMRRGLFAGGLAGVAAAAYLASTTDTCVTPRPGYPVSEYEECLARNSSRKTYAGFLGAAGLLSAAIASQISKGEPTDTELRRVADDYNRRPVAVTPVVMPGGGGVAVSGSF